MKRIKLASSQRTVSTDSRGNFKIALQTPIEGKYRLVTALITNSAYNVTTSNNTVAWTESKGSGNVTATITTGFYTPTTLASAVAAAMTAGTGTGSTFTGTYSTLTGKISFTSSPSTTLVFRANTINLIGPLMGYDGTETDPSLGGNNIANVQPLLSWNISINNTPNCTNNTGNTWTYTVPMLANLGDSYLYTPAPGYFQDVTFTRASVLTIQVTDDSSNIINLLSDWYLELQEVPKDSPIVFKS